MSFLKLPTCTYLKPSSPAYQDNSPALRFFKKIYAFKIFRNTTKLKKYSKFLTYFPKKFYIRRKRRTSNYNFVFAFSQWLQTFLLEKRVFKFIQGLGLHPVLTTAPNFLFLVKQLKKADYDFNLNTHFLPKTSRFLRPRILRFLCGLTSADEGKLLTSNQIWVTQRVGLISDTYSLSVFSKKIPHYNCILNLIFSYFVTSYAVPIYRLLTLLTLL